MSESIWAVSLTLQALTLATLSFFLFQLLRQQGRILLRLDSLEGSQSRKARTDPLTGSKIEREGLKAGVPAPSFTLPDIHGNTVSLDQFRGRNVLLVFTDPQCGPCDELAPRVARLHREREDDGLAVVMVGRGDVEQNRKKAKEHGIRFPVVLQDHWKLSRQYGIFATPVAFLIGKDGVIMKTVAKGSDEIMTLALEGLASG